MQKRILFIALTGILTTSSLISFSQENKKAAKARKEVTESKKDVVDAKQDVVDAKQNLKEAQIDSAADYKEFRKDAEMEINDNQKKIASLKTKRYGATDKENARYQKKILVLEKKNNELRKKINGTDHMKTDNWSEFKREFRHDMNQLGHSIRDIGVNNSK